MRAAETSTGLQGRASQCSLSLGVHGSARPEWLGAPPPRPCPRERPWHEFSMKSVAKVAVSLPVDSDSSLYRDAFVDFGAPLYTLEWIPAAALGRRKNAPAFISAPQRIRTSARSAWPRPGSDPLRLERLRECPFVPHRGSVDAMMARVSRRASILTGPTTSVHSSSTSRTSFRASRPAERPLGVSRSNRARASEGSATPST